jgi:hypothetical protein
MKINRSPMPPLRHESAGLEARFGLRLGALLTERVETSPHDITERLRFAREQALARAQGRRGVQLAGAMASGPVMVGRAGGAGLLGQPAPWLTRLASALPLVLLVGGLMLIDEWHDQAQIQAAAEIDTALLADDLPPGAYSDPGFVEFLKNPIN